MKTCSNCKTEKPFINFYKQKNSKDGYRSQCKKCLLKKQKEYDSSHPSKKKYPRKKYPNKKYPKSKEYNRLYYKNNKEARIKAVRKWQNKVKDDPFRKIKNRIKSAMRYHIKKGGRKTLDLLGYSKEQLLEHLKNNLPEGVSWEHFLENSKNFHIDHIIPQSIYKTEKEYLQKGWNLRNLRILPAKENLLKKDTIMIDLIEEYNIKDLFPS